MPRYLIIEDERLAYDELRRMMAALRPDYELAGWAQSVEQAVPLLQQSSAQLIFADVQLSDGLCFDAFEAVPTECAIIFTTAYDEYALRAFKLNSIDYLLKPIEEKELECALLKYERNALTRHDAMALGRIADSLRPSGQKERFLLRLGDTFRHILTKDIAYFVSEDKATFLCTAEGRRYVVDYSLDELEHLLPPTTFFRVSRNCIAGIHAVSKAVRYFGGRMRLTLTPPCEQEVIVSRSRAGELLQWMDGCFLEK